MSDHMRRSPQRNRNYEREANGNSLTEKKISEIKILLDWLKSKFKMAREKKKKKQVNQRQIHNNFQSEGKRFFKNLKT